jgi:hypothetical protein
VLELSPWLRQVQVQVLRQVQVQVQVLRQELEQELRQEQVQVQVLRQVQVQVLRQALVQVLHQRHRPLQSLFQQQRFHLQQLESLSMSLQSGMELRYLLCQLILRTMARLQQSCRQLF